MTELVPSTTENTKATTGPEFIDIQANFENEERTTPITIISTTYVSPIEAPINKTRRDKLSDQIRAVIRHYKKFGTVTVPDASSIPDPMSLPNIKKSFSGMEMTFTNQKVYGLSNFTIEHINTDLDKMQVSKLIFDVTKTYINVYVIV